jgi:thiamine pyrophosphokinase
MDNDRFSILLAGSLVVTPRVRGQVAGTRVIAADGGIAHAATLGLEPELWVGDFDSSGADLHERFAAIERQSHPPAKDATDGELAVDEAIRRGAADLLLLGGFGGRSDHQLQHFAHALALAGQGREVLMTSGHEEAVPLLAGERQLDLPPGSQFSIIAFSNLTGLSLSNVEWPLTNRDMSFGSSLTMSNVARGPVDVRLQEGRAVVIADVSGVLERYTATGLGRLGHR